MKGKLFAMTLTLSATIGALIPLATATGPAEAGACNYRKKIGVATCTDCWGPGTSNKCDLVGTRCGAPAGCDNKFLPWGRWDGGGWF